MLYDVLLNLIIIIDTFFSSEPDLDQREVLWPLDLLNVSIWETAHKNN